MAALSRNSEQALGPQLRKLEQTLTQQLQDPAGTAGKIKCRICLSGLFMTGENTWQNHYRIS